MTDSVTEFIVDMSCGNCQKKVNAALVDVPGVKQVDIDLATKRVYDDAVPRLRKPV
jgi:copper chaperone CopZ